jgi:hypothetical protein
MSDTINRRPLTLEQQFRRLTKIGQRGMMIEYTLIILLTAFAAFQVLVAVGARAGSI